MNEEKREDMIRRETEDERKVYVVVYQRIDLDDPLATENRVEGVFADEGEACECMGEDWGDVLCELDNHGTKVAHNVKWRDNAEIQVGEGDELSVVFRWRVVKKSIHELRRIP